MDVESLRISEFTPVDLPPVIALLDECMPLEQITIERFTRKVLLDPNFDVRGAQTAREPDGAAVGFVLAIAPETASEGGTDLRGYVTLIGVARRLQGRGLGAELLRGAETYLASRGCTSISISAYGPGYWIPGVDPAAYPEALEWLVKRGYSISSRPLSMESDLTVLGPTPPRITDSETRLRDEGVVFAPFTPHTVLPVLELLTAEFGQDWARTARETMHNILGGQRTATAIWTATADGRCLGFAHFDGERFGPIGVAQRERGRGIGAVLMYRALASMHSEGSARAYFLWTSDATAERLYRPAGFREVRRFHILGKPL